MDSLRRKSPAPSATPSLLGNTMTGALRKLSLVERDFGSETSSAAVSPGNELRPEPPDMKGPLGLTLLYDNADAQIDLIFVHGLGGGSRKTWSFSSEPRHYWPKEWLSKDPEFRQVRVHSFGYKADWNERKESILNVQDFARFLMAQIRCSPHIRKSKTKIVLIAHSMGGIVIKKAYILAREDPGLKDIADRIHTLYFLATPHRGSDLAKTLANILKISFGSKPFVTGLVPSSESIASTNDSFRHFAEDVELWSFYETLPSNLGLMRSLIVNPSSAILGYPREYSSLMNADHRGICKFDRQTDPNYQILRNALITTIEKISSNSEKQVAVSLHRQLTDLTGVTEPPVDELATLNELRAPQSCEWIASRESYSKWLSFEATSQRPILWITGNAGFGKSVLSSYIISNIQQGNNKCCYFFFKHGNSTKSSILGCLRSLAYQMAESDPHILENFVEIQKDSSSQDQWNEKIIWRKFFTGCLFKHSNTQPCFWVLDGLDECHQFPTLVSLIAQIPTHLRILITSRKTPETTKSLHVLSGITEHFDIQESDTLGDLSSYIDYKMDSLPVGDVQGQQHLKGKILKKASGSFLWVSLIISDLENAFSEEDADAEEILNEVPTDMNDFYARMIGALLQNPRAALLAKPLFMWTLMAFRSLNLAELQFVLKLDTNQTVPNLAKVLPVICGQLLTVNPNMKAEVIHQTAKSYLLQQQTYPELILNEESSHNRMTRLCLEFLTGNQFEPQGHISDRRHSSSNQTEEFATYACDYFSQHLEKCSPQDKMIWELLCKFLSTNVLKWIENLAKRESLESITKTAKNLRAYLNRRAEYISLFSPDEKDLEIWIHDLIRMSAKFGRYLRNSPCAMTNLIPQLCPSDSQIRKTYVSKRRGLVVKGSNDKSWDDCIARIEYTGRQACAIACGEQFSAVAISNGTIYLYHLYSVQLRSTLDNKTRATILTFSNEDRYLASNGFRSVNVWNVAEGTQIWSFNTNHQPLTIMFVDDNLAIATATQGNYMLAWDLSDGQQVRKWQWNSCVTESQTQDKPTQPPGKALFSPDHRTLAVTYRGLPIFLFDIQMERLIGCCSREARLSPKGASNEYIIDALTFNPRSDIDVLVVSYGDGELVVYDVETAELRYRIPDVYAHSLACSRGGRTIVTGSPRGTIQIFKFAGINRKMLVPIYKIDAHDNCIKAIAFSSDGLRFVDIRGSQYRVWEPAVLGYHDSREEISTELSQPICGASKLVSMMEGPLKAEISVMCCSTAGDSVFCGKYDGSVVYFETCTANEKGVLYRHATGIRVTSIIHLEKTSLIATADEAARILITRISSSSGELKDVKFMTEIRLQESITSLLANASGTMIIVSSKDSFQIWTTEGEKWGSSIPHNNDATVINHPASAAHFIIMEHKRVRIFSWTDRIEVSVSQDLLVEPSFTATPLSHEISTTYSSRHSTESNADRSLPPYIAKFTKGNSTIKPLFHIWSAPKITNCNDYPLRIQVPDLDILANNIIDVIAITGSLIIFLDTDLWVCSLDMELVTSETHGAKRHFFLLPEWQTVDGGFIIDYVPASKEFVIAKNHELLVIGRGLECAEPWFPTWNPKPFPWAHLL